VAAEKNCSKCLIPLSRTLPSPKTLFKNEIHPSTPALHLTNSLCFFTELQSLLTLSPLFLLNVNSSTPASCSLSLFLIEPKQPSVATYFGNSSNSSF